MARWGYGRRWTAMPASSRNADWAPSAATTTPACTTRSPTVTLAASAPGSNAVSGALSSVTPARSATVRRAAAIARFSAIRPRLASPRSAASKTSADVPSGSSAASQTRMREYGHGGRAESRSKAPTARSSRSLARDRAETRSSAGSPGSGMVDGSVSTSATRRPRAPGSVTSRAATAAPTMPPPPISTSKSRAGISACPRAAAARARGAAGRPQSRATGRTSPSSRPVRGRRRGGPASGRTAADRVRWRTAARARR